MFYDGVFDNLDGMKFVSPGECWSYRGLERPSHSDSYASADRDVHGLRAGHRGVQGAQLQGIGLVPLRRECDAVIFGRRCRESR